MKRIFSLALVIAITLSSALSVSAIELTDITYDWEKLKGQNITLNVFNWGEYMSLGQDDSMHVNDEFEKLTGIKVNYQMFANNEEMYTKLKSGGADYDIVIPSDYMIGKMIDEDMLQPVDFTKVPNFQYIGAEYKNSAFDKENKYYVPYTWGTVGIIYNTTMVDTPVDSWEILWDEKYKGEILMFANSRDAFAISLVKNGLSMNPTDLKDIETAKEDLKAQKNVVQAYVNDEIFDKMGGGEAALAPYYAGDAITMIADNPDLAFVVPKEGTNYFVDGAVILKNAANVEAAHMYINFLCETQVAAANAEFIGYSTPHTLALEILDEEVRNNPIAYPSKEVLEKTEAFITLPEEINEAMDKAWSEIRSYNEHSNNMFMPIVLGIGVVVLILLIGFRSKQKKKIDY